MESLRLPVDFRRKVADLHKAEVCPTCLSGQAGRLLPVPLVSFTRAAGAGIVAVDLGLDRPGHRPLEDLLNVANANVFSLVGLDSDDHLNPVVLAQGKDLLRSLRGPHAHDGGVLLRSNFCQVALLNIRGVGVAQSFLPLETLRLVGEFLEKSRRPAQNAGLRYPLSDWALAAGSQPLPRGLHVGVALDLDGRIPRQILDGHRGTRWRIGGKELVEYDVHFSPRRNIRQEHHTLQHLVG